MGISLYVIMEPARQLSLVSSGSSEKMDIHSGRVRMSSPVGRAGTDRISWIKWRQSGTHQFLCGFGLSVLTLPQGSDFQDGGILLKSWYL